MKHFQIAVRFVHVFNNLSFNGIEYSVTSLLARLFIRDLAINYKSKWSANLNITKGQTDVHLGVYLPYIYTSINVVPVQ